MWLGIAFLVATNVALLLVPRLVNEGITVAEQKDLSFSVLGAVGISPTIGAIVAVLIATALIGGVVRVLSRVVLFNVGRDVEHDLRATLFQHIMTLSSTFYGQRPTGDLMSRMTNDLTNVRLMAGFALLNAFNAVLVFGTNMPLLFVLDWRVALAALAPFPLVMGLAQFLAKKMYARTKANQEVLGKLTAKVQENLAGQSVVRAFSRGDAEEQKFEAINHESFEASMSLSVIRLVMFPLMGLMGALGVGISLYVGGRALLDGRIQTGDVVEITGRLVQLMWPATAFGFIMSVYQRGKASLVRINEVLDAQPDITDGTHVADVAGKVACDGLTVRYPGAARDALHDVHFSLEPGAVLGVVGNSGGGKSTLVKALSRQLVLDDGQLFFDDVDVNTWDLRALAGASSAGDDHAVRGGVALVPDDGFLFSATLRENLAFACPDASDDEIGAAVDMADLRRDIDAFADGLDTLVGERGVTLSGGQRQRVALARALLARPRVLILDDSLSAVDAETETRIVEALRQGLSFTDDDEAQRPATLVIVSHRLSAVKDAAEVLVLSDGEVKERGTHDELVAQEGMYATLWGTEQLKRALQG
mgnify:CR=1 FL=1